jgi:hypothetical protein
VPATQENKRRHGVTVAAAISSINFFGGQNTKILSALTLFLLM